MIDILRLKIMEKNMYICFKATAAQLTVSGFAVIVMLYRPEQREKIQLIGKILVQVQKLLV